MGRPVTTKDDEFVPTTTEAPLPDAQEVTRPTENNPIFSQESVNTQKVEIPKDVLDDLIKSRNEWKAFQESQKPRDALNVGEREKYIRITFWTDSEGNDYLVTGLVSATKRDGTTVNTWEKGKDELTDKPITWIKPSMVNLTSGKFERVEMEIRYDDFYATVRVSQVKVKKEDVRKVDLTNPNEPLIEAASYKEHGAYSSRFLTGEMVRPTVIGVMNVFAVEYEGRDYELSSQVINLK